MDLIERQAAIDALWREPGYIDPLNVMAEARDRIADLPSAQPEINQAQSRVQSSDCISRQAAITLPVMPKEHREYQTFNLDDAYEQGWNDLQKCIESLPSAQPERKKGRWIEYHKLFGGKGPTAFKCSVCGAMGFNCDDYKFCHMCGADMRGDT